MSTEQIVVIDSSEEVPSRWGRRDAVAVALLAVAAVMWCWWMNFPSFTAAEDAAILFRYVDNVSAGHGIVWNPGEAPVDGATDLGFLFLLVVVKAVGVSTQSAALIVNSVAFVAVAALLFTFARRRTGTLFATFLSALFIVSPAVGIMNVGFGAVLFSAVVALAVLAMFRMTDRPTPANAALMAGAGVAAGLVRPEGFIIGGALILTALAVGGHRTVRAAVAALGYMFVAGVAFVAARWAYFGFPLPNPYYKKGGGTLHPDGLVDSIKFAMTVGAVPVVLLVGIAMLAGVSRRWIAYTGCLGVLLGMWVLLSNEMNYGFRFQFAILVIALFMLAELGFREQTALSARLNSKPGLKRLLPVAAAVAVVLSAAATSQVVHRQIEKPAQQSIAEILASHRQHGLVVATSEAGYVCWQSGWTCIDLWGLNDKLVAHEGLFDESELGQLDPDVIVLHAFTSPICSSIDQGEEDYKLDGWEEMTSPSIRFAERGGYTLAAILQPRQDGGFVVYVRSGKPWSQDIIDDFRSIDPSIQDFYGPSAKAALPVNS